MKKVVLAVFVVSMTLSNTLVAQSPKEFFQQKKLYRKCAGCHGKDGKHVPFEKENGVLHGRDKQELKLIMEAIRDGFYKDDKLNKIMRKAIRKFSDKEIDMVAEYISEL